MQYTKQHTTPLSGLEMTVTHCKTNKFIKPKLLVFFKVYQQILSLLKVPVQVSYLKMSPSSTLLVPNSLSPNQNSYLSATPNTFSLQHLPPHKSPVAGSKASSDTYLPLEEPVPALPQVVQTPWQNKASKGLPCVIQLTVTVQRYCVFCGQTNTCQPGGGGRIHVQLACTYSQLRTTSTNSDCKGTTEIQYTIFCMVRGKFQILLTKKGTHLAAVCFVIAVKIRKQEQLRKRFQLCSCTHTCKYTKHAEPLLLLLSWHKKGTPAESFKHKPASCVNNIWLLLVSKCNQQLFTVCITTAVTDIPEPQCQNHANTAKEVPQFHSKHQGTQNKVKKHAEKQDISAAH